MKKSGSIEVGDLVYHYYDISKKNPLPGLVIGIRLTECLVCWADEKEGPPCWHKRGTLRVVQTRQGEVFDVSLTEYD